MAISNPQTSIMVNRHNLTHLTKHLIDPLRLLGVGEGTHLLQTGLTIVFNLLGVLDREEINPMELKFTTF